MVERNDTMVADTILNPNATCFGYETKILNITQNVSPAKTSTVEKFHWDEGKIGTEF